MLSNQTLITIFITSLVQNHPCRIPTGDKPLDHPCRIPTGDKPLDHPCRIPTGDKPLDHPCRIPTGDKPPMQDPHRRQTP